MADEVVESINFSVDILDQIPSIQNKILSQKNIVFMPKLVDAFIEISSHKYLWFDLTDNPILDLISKFKFLDIAKFDFDEIIGFCKIIASLIDFRSPFTANHSVGVAKVSEKLAEFAGFSQDQCKMMLVAGYLHDVGKLAIKKELIEKTGQLSVDEMNEIKRHSFYTYRLLKPIEGFETINIWASLHHEKLNGKGYPFNLTSKSIPLGSCIMAVADVFTAISEDRPYRKGMNNNQVIEIIKSMGRENSLSPYVVSILLSNFKIISELRQEVQGDTTK